VKETMSPLFEHQGKKGKVTVYEDRFGRITVSSTAPFRAWVINDRKVILEEKWLGENLSGENKTCYGKKES